MMVGETLANLAKPEKLVKTLPTQNNIIKLWVNGELDNANTSTGIVLQVMINK